VKSIASNVINSSALNKFPALRSRLSAALKEDGAFSDVTTAALGGQKTQRLKAILLCKHPGVFVGGFLARDVFGLLDRSARVSRVVADGRSVKRGTPLLQIEASAGALLAGERTFLNLVCRLSGIATLTRTFVEAVKGTGAAILETRKTTPLWRDLEKHAVVCGGGENHRFSLADAVLVKDNHWQMARASGRTIVSAYGPGSRVRKGKKPSFVAIEATTHRQVWEVIKARADIILLDNMPENRLKEAIVFVKAARRALKSDRPLIEVSGGIDVTKARRLARLGVDRLSVGALTHSAPALDISLEVL